MNGRSDPTADEARSVKKTGTTRQEEV